MCLATGLLTFSVFLMATFFDNVKLSKYPLQFLFSLLSVLVPSTVGVSNHNATLNAIQLNNNGAQLTYGPNVTPIGTNLSVNVVTQDDYDIKIAMDNSWQFKTYQSTMTITLYGYNFNQEMMT